MALKLDFNTRLNQKCTIVNEKYAVLDNSTVLYTMNCKWLTNYRDGHSILVDPEVTQVLFRKIKNSWRVINIVESGDNPIEVLAMLFEAAEGYVESARKIKSQPSILNQKTDEEYFDTKCFV